LDNIKWLISNLQRNTPQTNVKCNLFNPDYAIGFVTKLENAIISSVPARFYDEGMVIIISRNKIEETLEIEAVSRCSRISNA
jgi:hypothetical protein